MRECLLLRQSLIPYGNFSNAIGQKVSLFLEGRGKLAFSDLHFPSVSYACNSCLYC